MSRVAERDRISSDRQISEKKYKKYKMILKKYKIKNNAVI